MRVRIARSLKQPTLYSYYLSKFSDTVLQFLKDSRPFTNYIKANQEYEVAPEIYHKAVELEEVTSIYDERDEHLPIFCRTHFEKYGYQQDAIDFTEKTKDVFINFGQGMGKSLTTMKIIEAREFKRVLIICGQGNLQEEWIKDANKHNYLEKLNMRIVGEDTGVSNAKKIAWIKERGKESSVDLINIEAMRNVDIVEELNKREYECIVIDEVQSAKGWKAEQTEGIHELVRWEGQYRIALSGTPVLNNPLEFFSMLKFFGKLRDTARTTFEKYYGVWDFDYWGHYICKGYKNLQDLDELLRTLVCYAKKEELHLPKKTRRKIDLDWQPTERFMKLKSVYRMSIARLKKAGFTSKPQIRAEMQFISSMAEQKLEFIANLALNSRVLVFSQFTTVLENYERDLNKLGKKVLYYHGKLTMKERLEVLKKWREGDYDILLLSIMTARYGLNLTEADATVFLEPPVSFAVMEQAEDRAHRIGQTKEVTSYLLCATEIDRDRLDNMVTKQESLDELKYKKFVRTEV